MKRPDEETLKEFQVYYKPDTDFASHARLLQSKWRVKKGYKMNNKPKSNYGNFIETEVAKEKRLNYLTKNIRKLVSDKIIEIRKNGGLVGEPRIWNNLLSSQPLCFNLFGELYYDLELATNFFKKLFPDKVTQVTKIDFEYSSKRNNPDNSAFDVYVEYLNQKEKCFFGIEVKYQESLKEENQAKALKNFNNHKEEYLKLTSESKFFKEDVIDQLSKSPLAQIWRDHLLAYNMTNENITGSFIYLFPFENKECFDGVTKYQKLLISQNENENKFHSRDLSVFIKELHNLHNTEWTQELLERYVG
ncbi:MAG: hypothetical protein PHE33_04045 [Bacteroidales bacterium]|nr:hypothetical protein [Bacteroidales bacterium]